MPGSSTSPRDRRRRLSTSDIKPQVYDDPRPAEAMAPFHAWARTHEPGWTYAAVRVLLTPVALGPYRTRAIGRANVPADGPVILAPNHFSNMDHFFCGVYLRRQIRFMSKSQFFGGNPLLSYLFRVSGHFPVRRGHADEEAFATAHSILERGGMVGIYAEGGRSRSGGLGEPRPGVGRLALESGAPVVPVAIHGSAQVRGWRRGRFPRIRVSYGEPLSFDVDRAPGRDAQIAAAGEIFDRVRAMYAELEAQAAAGAGAGRP
jgi:1-acyl-sn-glycerol-3-phosphate acyltransferase